jgi:hypothetical protein
MVYPPHPVLSNAEKGNPKYSCGYPSGVGLGGSEGDAVGIRVAANVSVAVAVQVIVGARVSVIVGGIAVSVDWSWSIGVGFTSSGCVAEHPTNKMATIANTILFILSLQ